MQRCKGIVESYGKVKLCYARITVLKIVLVVVLVKCVTSWFLMTFRCVSQGFTEVKTALLHALIQVLGTDIPF